MEAQTLFNRVSTHLLMQKAQSKNSRRGCAYLGIDGLTCAVGCLMPPSVLDAYGDYDSCVQRLLLEIMEDGDAQPDCEAWAAEMLPHLNLLFTLQSCHDNNDNWEGDRNSMAESLQAIAKVHGLTFTDARSA